ncbi:MAG: response regulator [Verrucomicrobiae bacterium]|nr:response regulator [Verrucomicrobiae bacterium]
MNEPPSPENPRILLVEDDAENLDMLSRRLRRRGFEVIPAMDGQRALELAGEVSPDLILLDLSLPILDGWEVAKRLKAAEQTRCIPIIALTAYAMASDEKKALDAGCDDFDTKPVMLDRLLEKMSRFLGGSSGD